MSDPGSHGAMILSILWRRRGDETGQPIRASGCQTQLHSWRIGVRSIDRVSRTWALLPKHNRHARYASLSRLRAWLEYSDRARALGLRIACQSGKSYHAVCSPRGTLPRQYPHGILLCSSLRSPGTESVSRRYAALSIGALPWVAYADLGTCEDEACCDRPADYCCCCCFSNSLTRLLKLSPFVSACLLSPRTSRPMRAYSSYWHFS